MGATRATTQHDQRKSPTASPQLPQGQTSGQRQPEQGYESSPPLHRYLGNSYVQAMPTTPQRLGLQAKLTVNEPRDIYEQEADRVADQVMAAPTPANVRSAPLQIQRFSGPAHAQTDAAPASVGQTLASPGRPLEPLLRQDMEQRFGHDFSTVRVHADAAAEQSARDVNAQAYTLGHSIVFGAGQFAPGTAEGRRLIAHELTHVVQQSGAKGGLVGQAVASPVLQRKSDGKSPSEAVDPIEEKNFPEYAWHRVGTTSTHGRPSAAVIRDIVAENTNIGRELLAQTTSKFTYRERTVGPSYHSFTHPTRGIVVRACAILQGFHPEREPNPKVLAKENHSYGIYVFSPHSDKDPEHYNLPLPLSSAPPPDKESEEREKRRKTKEALPRLEEALRKAEEERAQDEYYQAILAYYVSPQKAADLKAQDEYYQAMLAYSASTRQSVLEHQAAALRAEVANMPVRQIYSQWKARKAAFLSVALSPDHRLNREQLFEIWRLYWGDRNEAARSSYGQIRYLPEKDRMAAVEAAEREEAATASMLRAAVDINEFLRAAEANGKHVTFQRINEVAMRWAGYRNAWINASAMFGARGALGSPSLTSLRLPKAPTVAPTAVRPAPPAVSARPPAVSVPGPKPIPVKVSGSTPAPGAPLAPVKPAGAAKNSPTLSFLRRDLIGGPFPPKPAKAATPAPAQPVTPLVRTPAPVKPTPPAASVSRPPASPLSRWDRVKGRLRTKYLEAAMRSKLDEVVPTKIAGGSLPGQRSAVTAKAPMPSPAPTPTPLPRTSARPPTVNPAQTRTPLAPSRPTTTGEVVKAPAPPAPTSPAATGRAVGTPAPVTSLTGVAAARGTDKTAVERTGFTHYQILDLFVRFFQRPGPQQGTIVFHPTQISYEEAAQAVGLQPGTLGFFNSDQELLHLPPTASTLTVMHEALHMIGRQSGVNAILGRYMEEGLTEWLARSLGPEVRRVYERNVAFVTRLAREVGEDALRMAYLHRLWEPLRSALRARLGSEAAVQRFYSLLRQVGPDGQGGQALNAARNMLWPRSLGAPAPHATSESSVGAQPISQMIDEEVQGLEQQPGSIPLDPSRLRPSGEAARLEEEQAPLPERNFDDEPTAEFEAPQGQSHRVQALSAQEHADALQRWVGNLLPLAQQQGGGMIDRIEVQGVRFTNVEVRWHGSELRVGYFGISRETAKPGTGILIHDTLEQAAVQVARQVHSRTVRVYVAVVLTRYLLDQLRDRKYKPDTWRFPKIQRVPVETKLITVEETP